jgi:hypothetical protein
MLSGELRTMMKTIDKKDREAERYFAYKAGQSDLYH